MMLGSMRLQIDLTSKRVGELDVNAVFFFTQEMTLAEMFLHVVVRSKYGKWRLQSRVI